MLLIVEFVLTVVAWRRGWGAKALLPLAGGIAAGFVTGLLVSAAGGSPGAAIGIGLVFDLACVAALAIMAIRGHEDPWALPAPAASRAPSLVAPGLPSYPLRHGALEAEAERALGAR